MTLEFLRVNVEKLMFGKRNACLVPTIGFIFSGAIQ